MHLPPQRHSLAVAFACVIGATTFFAQAPAATTGAKENSAPLRWEQTTIDLHPGLDAFQKSEVDAHYSFTNESGAPVKMISLRPDCECTSAEWSAPVIRSGERGEIIAHIATRGRYGRTETHVEVRTRAVDDHGTISPSETITTLTFAVTIPEPLVIRPAELRWAQGAAAEWKTATITSVNPEQLAIKNPRLAEEYAEFEVKFTQGEQEHGYRMDVRPKSTDAGVETQIHVVCDVRRNRGEAAGIWSVPLKVRIAAE